RPLQKCAERGTTQEKGNRYDHYTQLSKNLACLLSGICYTGYLCELCTAALFDVSKELPHFVGGTCADSHRVFFDTADDRPGCRKLCGQDRLPHLCSRRPRYGSGGAGAAGVFAGSFAGSLSGNFDFGYGLRSQQRSDRKSTRLNSSHVSISYAVFCLKKKI